MKLQYIETLGLPTNPNSGSSNHFASRNRQSTAFEGVSSSSPGPGLSSASSVNLSSCKFTDRQSDS